MHRLTLRLTLRRTLALAAAPVLLAALTACGGSDDSGEAADPPAASSESPAASDEASEGATEESDDTDAAEGDEVDKEEFLADFQEGMEDATTANVTMTTTAAGTTFDAEGEVDYTTDPPSLAMTMKNPAMGNQAMDVRLVDGTFYLNMGQMSQGKFYEIDLDDPNSPLGDVGSLADAMDPVRQFEMFAAGLDTVTFVGEEEVDGDDLEHYVLTVDTTKVEALQQSGAAGVPETLEYDLWLDDDDRMRQVKIDMGSTATVDMKVFAWDEPVDIEAPSANEIAPLPGG